jgi:hypothetical protein
MELQGTYRVKLYNEEGNFPRRWSNIDILFKTEEMELVTEIVEIKKIRRSKCPQSWNKTKKCWIKDIKKGKYRTWEVIKQVTTNKWVKKENPETVLAGKLHGTDKSIEFDNIACWKEADRERIPKELVSENMVFTTPGPTPLPSIKRIRNHSDKDLRELGYSEELISTLHRGYTSKMIERVQKRFKDDKTKKLLPREEARKLLEVTGGNLSAIPGYLVKKEKKDKEPKITVKSLTEVQKNQIIRSVKGNLKSKSKKK